jgi:dethiobiotin synthetase
LLTVHYALREGIILAGVIINYAYPPEETIAEKTNPLILKEICPVPILGIFPYLKDLKTDTIEKAALTNLDLEIIRKYLWRE